MGLLLRSGTIRFDGVVQAFLRAEPEEIGKCYFIFLKNSRVSPIVFMSKALTLATIGKSRTTFPRVKQCCGGKSLAMDLTVSASTRAARLTTSRSCSLVKLKRNMLSAWR